MKPLDTVQCPKLVRRIINKEVDVLETNDISNNFNKDMGIRIPKDITDPTDSYMRHGFKSTK